MSKLANKGQVARISNLYIIANTDENRNIGNEIGFHKMNKISLRLIRNGFPLFNNMQKQICSEKTRINCHAFTSFSIIIETITLRVHNGYCNSLCLFRVR